MAQVEDALPDTGPESTSADEGSVESPRITVVVPTYNEAENLPELVRRLFDLDLPRVKVLVVDDGSPDGTGKVAERLSTQLDGRVEVIQRGRKLGLGTAYVAGFSRAVDDGADVVIEMDADHSHDTAYLPVFLERLESADVVVGSRYVPGGGSEDWGAFRRFISGLGNFGIRWVAGLEVYDATSGFKAFRGSALRGLDMTRFRCRGFGFQAEVAHACQRMGYRVVEHPIIFQNRASGKSKMSPFIMLEALWRLLPLRWRGRREIGCSEGRKTA